MPIPIWLEEQRDNSKKKQYFVRNSAQMTEPERLRLAEEIEIWAKETDHVALNALFSDFGIYPDSFWDWCKQTPQLKQAWGQARNIIGIKRERMALEGKWNVRIVELTMPLYNPELREWKLEQLAAKEKANAGGGMINVSMVQMPETDCVPRKCEGTE